MGLGARLLDRGLDWARGRGAGRVFLWSDTRFTRAHRLYERAGFRLTDERQLDDINQSREYQFTIDL